MNFDGNKRIKDRMQSALSFESAQSLEKMFSQMPAVCSLT